MNRYVQFSYAHIHRYWLKRDWYDEIIAGLGPNDVPPVCDTLGVVMLNPSSADDRNDDPTMRSVIRLARRAGYTAVVVVNAFGLVATNRSTLRNTVRQGNTQLAIGPSNDHFIRRELQRNDVTRWVVAWGATLGEPLLAFRYEQMRRLFNETGRLAYCWGTTANGMPKHPLYLRSDVSFQPYLWEPVAETLVEVALFPYEQYATEVPPPAEVGLYRSFQASVLDTLFTRPR